MRDFQLNSFRKLEKIFFKSIAGGIPEEALLEITIKIFGVISEGILKVKVLNESTLAICGRISEGTLSEYFEEKNCGNFLEDLLELISQFLKNNNSSGIFFGKIISRIMRKFSERKCRRILRKFWENCWRNFWEKYQRSFKKNPEELLKYWKLFWNS